MENRRVILSIAVFTAGLCSIVYELLISTAATYFLGDGVRQFSLIIGVYLFSMGVGAYVAQAVVGRPLRNFILVEYVIGLIGGISVPLLYFAFTAVSTSSFQIFCLALIFVIGFLTGMEIPLLTFSFKDDHKENLSHVLSLDYIGGLAATLLFPFILLPFVGLYYSSLMFGIVNVVLGVVLALKYYPRQKGLVGAGLGVLLAMIACVLMGGRMLRVWENKIYKSPIVVNEQSPYQKVVITKRRDNVKLFINRVIQFASKDEHRYHESLVHVPFAMMPKAERILVLGGGENLATREILKYPEVRAIDIVDIDTMMFKLAMEQEDLVKINQLAPFDPRVTMIADDAFSYLHHNIEPYDIIISDLPDPNNQSIARLYSKQFFALAKRNLKAQGVFITQSGDINNSNSVFSCINKTLGEVFDNDISVFHAYVPSFGDWGFNIAKNGSPNPIDTKRLPLGLKYLDSLTLVNNSHLPKDVLLRDVKANTLDHPVILEYFLDEYQYFKANSM